MKNQVLFFCLIHVPTCPVELVLMYNVSFFTSRIDKGNFSYKNRVQMAEFAFRGTNTPRETIFG